jgi:DNA (cytosine-5)-methyltransferase 1
MGEQVAGAAGYGWLDGVRADLEREGYASRGVDIPACSVNAPHIRQRLYWIAVDKLANANDARFQGTERRRSARAEGEPAGHPTECDSGDMADASIIGRKEWERQDGQQDTRGVSKSGVDVAGADQSDVADAPNDGPILRTNSDGGWETHERRGDDNLRGERVGFGSPVCSDVEDSNGIRWLDGKHTKDGRQTRAVNQSGGGDGSFWSDHVWLTGADGKSRRVEPSIPLLAYGIPNRVGRLRAYGNAIVPPLAAEVIRAFMECEA